MKKTRKSHAGWEAWLEAAKAYRDTFGDLQVPFDYVNEKGMRLGRWIQRQRAAYEGKGGLMTADRIADLENLGMVWDRGHHTPWEEMYREAKKYYEAHGNLRIAHDYVTADGKKLGLWIKHQRDKCSGAVESGLSEEQKEKLEAIGMCWRVYGPASTWEDWYKEAAQFYKKYGHLNVHTQYVTPSGRRLGLWVKSQRYRGKDALTPKQVEQLNQLGMVWDVKSRTDWEVWYNLAREYWEAHGHLPESKDYVTEDGKKLGVWLSVQRERYSGKNKKALTEEQIALLNELGMEWKLAESHWNRMYQLAEAYYREHGDLYVPQNLVCPGGEKLGRWISLQRQAYRGKGTMVLTPRRQQLLEAIGMSWSPFDEGWEKMYQAAKAYRESKGDLLVPQNYRTPEGLRLGNWIANQRARMKDTDKRKLSQEQREKLEAIGMVWDPSKLREAEWEAMYECVKSYWLSHGVYPLDMELKGPKGKSMRGWYYQQKRALQDPEGKISEKRRKLLERIGIKG